MYEITVSAEYEGYTANATIEYSETTGYNWWSLWVGSFDKLAIYDQKYNLLEAIELQNEFLAELSAKIPEPLQKLINILNNAEFWLMIENPEIIPVKDESIIVEYPEHLTFKYTLDYEIIDEE